MTLALSKLIGSGKRITLHDGLTAAQLAAAVGVSVATWRNSAGFGPRDAMLTFKNDGAANLVIPTPQLLVSDGTRETSVGLLLTSSPLTLGPDEMATVAVPRDALAVGHLWRVYAVPTSASTVAITIEVEALQVEG